MAVGASCGPAATSAPGPRPTSPAKRVVHVPVALLHFAPKLGQRNENEGKLALLVDEALRNGAQIVVAPELSTTGYSITEADVRGGLGSATPFSDLAAIEAAARRYHGYVFVGVAETNGAERPFNSVVAFGPEGLLGVQRKRGASEWHARGNTPIEVFRTPLGDIAPLICSDAFLPDVTRIATLKGADIVVAPTNWWGASGQLRIWQARARENGVWFLVANRWGTENDRRHGAACGAATGPACTSGTTCVDGVCAYTYDMSNAPSVVVAPDGDLRLVYRAEDEPIARDRVLYATIDVDASRIGNEKNGVRSVAQRRPAAYEALANAFFIPPPGTNAPPLDLPSPAPLHVAAYVPPAGCSDACATRGLAAAMERAADARVWVLPALAVSAASSGSPDTWNRRPPWSDVQGLVDRHAIDLLVTSVNNAGDERIATFSKQKAPVTRPPVHTSAGATPWIMDVDGSRIGVVLGDDVVFPEIGSVLAKSGVDTVLITSRTTRLNDPEVGSWCPDRVLASWYAASNNGLSIVGADEAGFALITHDGGGWIESMRYLGPTDTSRAISSTLVPARATRHLDYYYPFDLAELLGHQVPGK